MRSRLSFTSARTPSPVRRIWRLSRSRFPAWTAPEVSRASAWAAGFDGAGEDVLLTEPVPWLFPVFSAA